MNDQPIPRRLRFEVLRRDNHTCRYCGASAPDVALTVDHIIPRALGGSNDPSNLTAACRGCNSGKASIAPDSAHVAAVDAKAVQWASALQTVADQRRADLQAMDNLVDRFNAKWNLWFYGAAKDRLPRDEDWETSIRRFAEAGLTIEDLERFVDVAGDSRTPAAATWKYFCGCCWNEVNRRQQMALDYLDAPTTTPAEDDESPDYCRGYDDGFHDGGAFERSRAK